MGRSQVGEGFVLVLMDLQEALCRPEGRVGRSGLAAEVERRGVLTTAATTLAEFRGRAWPVVHVRVAFDATYSRLTSSSPRFGAFKVNGLMLETEAETAIVAELAPVAGETVIDKGCVNPFVGTRLHSVLTGLAAQHLVLGGVATNHVVEGTARYASDWGYRVTVLEDLCASGTRELHEFSVDHILPAYAAVDRSDRWIAATDPRRP